MHQPRAAVFAGSFDPVTRGHVDLVRRAAALFDRVVVAVAVNSGKQPLFSLEERVTLVRGALDAEGVRADVARLDGLLVAFARAAGARYLVRGVRTVADFEYEQQMARMNRHVAPKIDTVFLSPAPELAWVSSTLVREVARLGERVDALVTPNVAAALDAKFGRGATA
ncbi:MAG: pantetheine-phosphate adenylyltransferase [Candidatus Eremiobacteraeota bacterium]|nr:pantetheine-phosphate adenylyltransferase [Candidatus Eremiobacteraeota bacterium]